MIQDMFDPEYYLAVYETTNPADNTTVSVVSNGNHLAWLNKHSLCVM